MNKDYRIMINPEYSWAEFMGWRWVVFHKGREVTTDRHYFRWVAVRRAEKYVRQHAKGLASTPAPSDHLNYWYDPNTDQGWAVKD